MSKLRVHCFSLSLDGYGAGPQQSVEHPLGIGGEALHQWLVDTRTFQKMQGSNGGNTGIDDDFVARGFDNVGAWIIGRNMFGPVRGGWPDESWKGWWGDDPPYHCEVFVLSHYRRESFEMAGGTTFHFVTRGIEAALEPARQAANGRDVRLGGGVETVRQYLLAGWVDEVHLAMAPILLGSGEPLLAGIDLNKLGFTCSEYASSEKAAHYVLTRQESSA